MMVIDDDDIDDHGDGDDVDDGALQSQNDFFRCVTIPKHYLIP